MRPGFIYSANGTISATNRGLKHSCLHTCLPLFALRLCFPLRTSILQKNCVYDRCARASRPDITKNLRLTKNQEILILLQCNLIDRLHCRSPLVVQQLIGLELLRKDLGVACSRSWYLATTTSICWWRSENIHVWVLPDHNPHRSSLVQVQGQVSIERNQNIQCIQIWVCKSPCSLEQRSSWLEISWQ